MKFFMRRKFILDKKFQLSLLAISLSYVLIFFAVSGSMLFLPLIVAIDGSEYASPEALEAARHILFLHENFWPGILICFFLVCMHSIRTSHRVAGPLYRINIVLTRIKQGLIPCPLRPPRKGDYLTDELALVNEMLKSLRSGIEGIQDAEAMMGEVINQCRDTKGTATQDEMLDMITALNNAYNQLKLKTNAIKLEYIHEEYAGESDGILSCDKAGDTNNPIPKGDQPENDLSP